MKKHILSLFIFIVFVIIFLFFIFVFISIKSGPIVPTSRYSVNSDEDYICRDIKNVSSKYNFCYALYSNKGDDLMSQGLYKEALSYYENSLKIMSGDETLLMKKAYALIKLNRYQDAINEYDKMINNGISNDSIISNKCNVLWKASKYLTSITCYLKSIFK